MPPKPQSKSDLNRGFLLFTQLQKERYAKLKGLFPSQANRVQLIAYSLQKGINIYDENGKVLNAKAIKQVVGKWIIENRDQANWKRFTDLMYQDITREEHTRGKKAQFSSLQGISDEKKSELESVLSQVAPPQEQPPPPEEPSPLLQPPPPPSPVPSPPSPAPSSVTSNTEWENLSSIKSDDATLPPAPIVPEETEAENGIAQAVNWDPPKQSGTITQNARIRRALTETPANALFHRQWRNRLAQYNRANVYYPYQNIPRNLGKKFLTFNKYAHYESPNFKKLD